MARNRLGLIGDPERQTAVSFGCMVFFAVDVAQPECSIPTSSDKLNSAAIFVSDEGGNSGSAVWNSRANFISRYGVIDVELELPPKQVDDFQNPLS